MYVFIRVYVHTQTQWNTIQPQKEQNFAICGNMDGLSIMLNEVSQRKNDLIYMWNLKNSELENITEKKHSHGYREQTSGYQHERKGEMCNIEVG